jgi:signal transduction histidine kinase
VDKERSRIFGDLHDDLGAKLLSLVYKSETHEQKILAKQAMQGLREIVKQSPVYTNQFAAPLLAWRTECQQRAIEHQAQLQWHQAHITDAYQLPEKINLQLSMVLREALSNALKHGDGKNIRIRIQLRFDHLLMSVHNQGNRFIANHTGGSGKHNMQQRIQNIGGRIRWRANKHGGCHVAWAVPLQGGLND